MAFVIFLWQDSFVTYIYLYIGRLSVSLLLNIFQHSSATGLWYWNNQFELRKASFVDECSKISNIIYTNTNKLIICKKVSCFVFVTFIHELASNNILYIINNILYIVSLFTSLCVKTRRLSAPQIYYSLIKWSLSKL